MLFGLEPRVFQVLGRCHSTELCPQLCGTEGFTMRVFDIELRSAGLHSECLWLLLLLRQGLSKGPRADLELTQLPRLVLNL